MTISTAVILVIIAMWLIHQGEKNQILKQQKLDLEIRENIRKTNEDQLHRKEKFKTFSADANLEWLRKHRCKDCTD